MYKDYNPHPKKGMGIKWEGVEHHYTIVHCIQSHCIIYDSVLHSPFSTQLDVEFRPYWDQLFKRERERESIYIYLYQSSTFCLEPRSSFLKAMPTTLGTFVNMTAIRISARSQGSRLKYLSPKKPLPSESLQHQPGLLMWLSSMIIKLLALRLDTTA